MAEPGAITSTEAMNLNPPITFNPWNAVRDSYQRENYWLRNLYLLCQAVWPTEIEDKMDAYIGGSCTFWMSLPPGNQVKAVPRPVVNYFLEAYLKRFLGLFPNAVILAAGGKAQQRLSWIKVDFVSCSAFTRPEANKPRARESWMRAGIEIAQALGGR